MDVASFPETLDFVGPAESTTLGRQAMVRYSYQGIAIALENPITTVTPNGGGNRITSDDNTLPDLAARYTHKGDFGHLQIATLLRQLKHDDENIDFDASTLGWGLSLSGRLNLGQDDIRWMLTHGDGLGRYVGLNLSNAVVITSNDKLNSISSIGGFISYRHWWSTRWRSTLVMSYQHIDNPTRNTGLELTQNAWSSHINLLYNPAAKLTFGVEYLYAERKLESGNKGSLSRFQFSGKYSFQL